MGATVGYMIVLAGALALVVGVLATLILLEREDGRVEREVERKTGRTGHERPARAARARPTTTSRPDHGQTGRPPGRARGHRRDPG